MIQNLYKNYFKNHSYSDIKNQFEIYFWTYSLNFKNDAIKPGLKVLEIWSWQWNFASFCQKMWITNYTGIEIDSEMAEYTQKIFPEYNILSDDAIKYLEKYLEKYDIIFSSHVFEHFSIEDGIHLATLIKEHLIDDTGRWINIMPNASSIMAWLGRYNDITHKVLYTENSFNQVLKMVWFQKEKK